jgi:hypothetical protein
MNSKSYYKSQLMHSNVAPQVCDLILEIVQHFFTITNKNHIEIAYALMLMIITLILGQGNKICNKKYIVLTNSKEEKKGIFTNCLGDSCKCS